jgi:hypothetical protein
MIFTSKSIRQAFRDVGLALPINRSQDSEIKIKDLPNIQVGNWQDWTPTKGVEQPSVLLINTIMSNRTLKEIED